MKILFVACLVVLGCQLTTTQVLRPPYNFFNRPGTEKIVEAGNFIPSPSPRVISEPAVNSFVPVNNRESYSVSKPSTTIITDCSPTICKNLVNTIQLMIACNLLQNKGSSEMALQLAAPIVNEALSTSSLSCGCANSISPVSPKIISPNVVSPSVISPNFLTSNIPYTSNIKGQNALSLTPTPTSIYHNNIMPISPSVPMSGQMAITNDLLNNLASLLSNAKL